MKETKNTQPALLNEKEASIYIGTTPNNLKLSRHTGELYKGIPAPAHIRCGAKAIRYSIDTLNEWLDALPEFTSNADARQRGYEIHCNAHRREQPP